MEEKVKEITEEGKQKLIEELDYLINVKQPENLARLAEARAQGDLSENSDYDAAKNEQSEIASRIETINKILKNSVVVKRDKKNDKIIGVGSKVKILDLSNKKETTYFIVGSVESDPLANKISNESPLGLALTGQKAGDEVDVKSKVAYKVRILSVERSK